MTTNPPQPACSSAEGCHRVLACNPGCAVTTAVSVPAPAPTTQPGTWFDRSICPEPCGRMHHRDTTTGTPVDECPHEQGALRDRIAEALRPGSRDRSGQYPEGLLRDVDAVLAVLPAPTDRAAEWRAAADHLETLDPTEAALAGQHAWADAARELRRAAAASGSGRVADETQQDAPWLSDSARIGRTLTWSWSDIGKGAYGNGYRDAQTQARVLLGGPREADGEQQQPAVVSQPDGEA